MNDQHNILHNVSTQQYKLLIIHVLHRSSQQELSEQLDALIIKLRSIEEIQETSPELESYVHKLINIKHKVTVIYSVLQGAQVRRTFCSIGFKSTLCIFICYLQDRLHRIHKQIDREKIKRRSILDSELLSSPATSSQSGL